DTSAVSDIAIAQMAAATSNHKTSQVARMQSFVTVLLLLSFIDLGLALSQASGAAKHEKFQNANVVYDWVTDNHHEQLRTFITRPKAARDKVPVIFFVGWLSCDSV